MGKTVTLDMTDYDEDRGFTGGGGGFYIPEGKYEMKCTSAESKRSKSSDNPMIEFQFTGTSGKGKGKKFFLYALTDMSDDNNRQKMGQILTSLGIEFERKKFQFDPDSAEDIECVGEVYTDDYNGQKRSKLRMIFPVGEEEEEVKPSRKSNGKKPIKLSEDEVNDMEEGDLDDLNTKHDLELDMSKLKTLSRKRKAVLEALSEKDLIA